MRVLSLCLSCTLLSSLIFAPASRACGDKLVPIGGGISFARISDDQPVGTIVIFADAMQLDQHRRTITGLRRALERAGHQVLVISDADQLRTAMGSNAPDLVLTSIAPAADVPANLPPPAAAPVVLRMTYATANASDRSAPASAAATGTCTVEAGKRSSRQVVRTVAEILRQRSEGVPTECGGTS